MILLLIIIGVLSVLIVLFGRTILYQYKTITEISNYLNLLDFIEGGEVDEKLILRKYEHAILLISYIEHQAESIAIWDVSQYEKNNVIGLTIYGLGDVFDQALIKIQQQNLEELQDLSKEDFLELRQSVKDILANQGVTIIDRTIYQMKDGSWLWR